MQLDPAELVKRCIAGDRGAVAKLISIVEAGGPRAFEVAALLHPSTGRAYTIGLTGAPGAGKSSLTDALIKRIRSDGDEVAILAIDPTSSFTGGAILGDRVRMQEHALDRGVYIRSMATRGHLGGLALAAPQAVRVLDASGKPWIIIETVGVGQVEVEIAGAADTTVVVVNPGWGDGVQANKAGLMEIADVFVVNKSDRPGTLETIRDLEMMLDLSGHPDWRAPIVQTVATNATGIEEFWQAILAHRAFILDEGRLEARREARAREELRNIVLARLASAVEERCAGDLFEMMVDAVSNRRIDPYTAAAEILGV